MHWCVGKLKMHKFVNDKVVCLTGLVPSSSRESTQPPQKIISIFSNLRRSFLFRENITLITRFFRNFENPRFGGYDCLSLFSVRKRLEYLKLRVFLLIIFKIVATYRRQSVNAFITAFKSSAFYSNEG